MAHYKIPDDDYGDPTGKRYPVRSQDDINEYVRAEIDPDSKVRLGKIAERKKLRLPQTWLGQGTNQPVLTDAKGTPDGIGGDPRYYKSERAKMHAMATFSAEKRRVDGEYAVYPDQYLFKAGDYPAHGLSLTAAEMAAAVPQFRPLAGNIEHTEFLQGQAVFVDAIRVDAADPEVLRGDVRVPLWLDEKLGDREKRLSAEWHKSRKTLDGMALVVSPAIPEADLVATFAKHGSRHAKHVFQGIHDMAAASGAYCVDPPRDTMNQNAAFIMRHERGAFQKIHDHAVESGAACHGSSAYFAAQKKRNSQKEKGKPMPLLSKILKSIGQAPAEHELDDAEVTALFAKLTPETPAAEAKVEDPKVVADLKVVETADFKKDPEFVRLQRENAAFKTRVLLGDAREWADAEVKDKRALPAETPAMIALFAQAALDDEADSDLARFSATSKALGASRVEMLKACYAARPAHTLYEEFLQNPAPEGATLLTLPSLASFAAKGKADPKEVDELRGYTTLLTKKAN